jgi:hypothetical protein
MKMFASGDEGSDWMLAHIVSPRFGSVSHHAYVACVPYFGVAIAAQDKFQASSSKLELRLLAVAYV